MSFFDMFKPSSPSPSVDKEVKMGDNTPDKTPEGKMPGTDQLPANPLDAYKEMFDNAAKNSDIQAPSFKLDSETLNKVSSNMDFTKGIPEELMQKALGGDAGALLKVLQSASQNSYKAALEHTTALTDTFINQRGEYESKKVNDNVRRELTTQSLSDTPNFDHPVVRAELTRVAQQFAAANPEASPKQIADQAKKYISDLQNALSPSSPTASKQQSAKDTDWDTYFKGE